MDNVILAVAVVAVHQFISAVATLFFDVPTLHEQRLEKKQKREQTAYKRNCSVRYNTPTSRLEAKLSLLDVLADDNRAYMHKVTHLHTWHFFLLAERLRPLIKRPRNGKQKAGPTCKHDYLH
jgi:hypothetical protein